MYIPNFCTSRMVSRKLKQISLLTFILKNLKQFMMFDCKIIISIHEY